MTTYQFREYDTRHGVPLTPLQVQVLRSRFGCDVFPSDTSGQRFDVRARGKVGALAVDGSTLVVVPKIPIARVLVLLAHTADPTWSGEADLGEADDLTDGVVSLFTAMCERAFRNGVLRGYLDRDDRLHTVRGRVDFAEQLRTDPGRDLPLAVRYQDHATDIVENQILRAAVDAASLLPLHGETTRRSLDRVRRPLAEVQPFRETTLQTVTWTRLNQHYHAAVELAQLILNGSEPNLHAGSARVPGLVIDMATVFEEFVRTAIREELGATEQQFPTGSTAALPLDADRRLLIEPDLSRWVDGRCRFVGELKYRYDSGQGSALNLYQTIAYAIASGLPEATLVYADGPDRVLSHYLPNIGVRVHVRHLDLDVARTELATQIRTLAEHIQRTV